MKFIPILLGLIVGALDYFVFKSTGSSLLAHSIFLVCSVSIGIISHIANRLQHRSMVMYCLSAIIFMLSLFLIDTQLIINRLHDIGNTGTP